VAPLHIAKGNLLYALGNVRLCLQQGSPQYFFSPSPSSPHNFTKNTIICSKMCELLTLSFRLQEVSSWSWPS